MRHKPVAPVVVSKYPVSDLMNASYAAFQVPPEVVFAACRLAGLTEASREEAQRAITYFLEQESP